MRDSYLAFCGNLSFVLFLQIRIKRNGNKANASYVASFHTFCLLSRKVILNKRLKATQTPKRGEKKVKEKNKTSSCLFIFSKNFALQRRYGEFTGSVEMNTQRN